jgi:hypothetical protein
MAQLNYSVIGGDAEESVTQTFNLHQSIADSQTFTQIIAASDAVMIANLSNLSLTSIVAAVNLCLTTTGENIRHARFRGEGADCSQWYITLKVPSAVTDANLITWLQGLCALNAGEGRLLTKSGSPVQSGTIRTY